MPDPIQGVTPTGPLEIAQTGQAVTSSGTAPTPPAAPSGSIDSANVTRAETLLATITQAAGSVPGVDAARIAPLQQAIQSGNYQPDPQQIAQKMLQLEALLMTQGGNK